MDAGAIPLIELGGVSRRFGADPPVDALREVDLTIDEGDWIAVVGPSGSGKSTLLNILGCLDQPTAGSYRLAGTEVTTLSDAERSWLRSEQLGSCSSRSTCSAIGRSSRT